MDFIGGEMKAVGRESKTRNGRSEERVITGPSIAIVSIPETYRLLRARAEAAGFVVDGRRIFKIEPDAEGDTE